MAHARLAAVDAEAAARIHGNDEKRIIRALEVYEQTGVPISRLQQLDRQQRRGYNTRQFGLMLPREELYRRIEARVQAMLAQGWLKEVRELLGRYPPDLKPLQALGYRHLIAFLQGRWGWEEALELLLRDTRRYAKRQLTWFKADPEVRWHSPDQAPEMLTALREFFGR